MKKLFTAFSILASLFILNSCGISKGTNILIKDVDATVQQIKYPRLIIPKDNRSYRFNIISSRFSSIVPPTQYNYSNFQIRGWSQVDNKPGVEVNLVMDEPILNESALIVDYVTEEVSHIDPRDSIRHSYLDTVEVLYSREVSLYGRSRVDVVKWDGNVLYSTHLTPFNSNFCTPKFNSQKKLRRWLSQNGDERIYNMMGDLYNHQICQSRDILDDQLAYYEYPSKVALVAIATKSDPMYNEFNSMVYGLENLLEKYQPLRNASQIKSEMKYYHNYFEKVLNLNENTKRDTKLRYMAARNLTQMNRAVENFDQALAFSQVWLETDRSKYIAYDVRNSIYDQQNLKALNNWRY